MKRMVLAMVLAVALPAVAEARQQTPAIEATGMPAGKGQVIFFRKGGIVGAAISCAIHERGEKLSSLPPGRYAALVVEPGAHDYSVKSEATNTLHLDVSPGTTSYAQCTIGAGFMAGHSHLKLVDAATFATMAAKLKPVTPKA